MEQGCWGDARSVAWGAVSDGREPRYCGGDRAAARQIWEELGGGQAGALLTGRKASGQLHVSSAKSSHGSFCATLESAFSKKVM